MDIMKLLKEKLQKYGAEEYICSADDLKKDWQKYTSVTEVALEKTSDIWVRGKLLPVGRIVEEDLEAHTYALVFEVGKPFGKEAFAVTAVKDNTLLIAAFAKEKLFTKGTAEKAAKELADRFTKH